MRINTTISRKLDITKQKEEYDENAKWLLAEKPILSRIILNTVSEVDGMNADDVSSLIEGEPLVSIVGIEPGETNSSVIGKNSEDIIPLEGKVTYDIRVTLRLPDGNDRIRIHIDLEAQKSFYPGYDIVTRGVYNSARMISAQKNTEFMKSNYQDIKPVYSIWICMNVPKYAKNTITMYEMRQRNIVGDFPVDKGYYDIPHVVIIGLSNEVTDVTGNPLLRMLETVFSKTMNAQDKKRILEEEYHIPMTEHLERRMSEMCNLSEGIWESGINEGEDRMAKLIKWLLDNGRMNDLTKAAEDTEYRKLLFAESGI